jgi:hypothetical protein
MDRVMADDLARTKAERDADFDRRYLHPKPKRRAPEQALQRQIALLERFEAKFTPDPNSGCWLWLASCLKDRYGHDSYGVFGWGIDGRATILAHRAAWILYRGELPAFGIDLRHRCDNRLCVNPDHLVSGTRAENMQDAIDRGRIFKGSARAALSVALWERNYERWCASRPRGESHHATKITDLEVREIRASKEPSSVLAIEYAVDASTIRRIRRGVTRRST